MAGVLRHALAPEVVGEDAPAQRGAGPHVGVVDDRPHVVVHEFALQGAAVAQAARPGQQRRGPGRREPARRWSGVAARGWLPAAGEKGKPGSRQLCPRCSPPPSISPNGVCGGGVLLVGTSRPWARTGLAGAQPEPPRPPSGREQWLPPPGTSPAFPHPGQQQGRPQGCALPPGFALASRRPLRSLLPGLSVPNALIKSLRFDFCLGLGAELPSETFLLVLFLLRLLKQSGRCGANYFLFLSKWIT